MLFQAGFAVSAALTLSIVLGLATMSAAGERLAAIASPSRVLALPGCLVIGYTLFSVLALGLVFVLPIAALTAYWIAFAVVVLAMFVPWQRQAEDLPRLLASVLLEVLFTLILLVALIYFCRNQISSYASFMASGTFHPWMDQFVHAAQIAQFGDALAVGHGDILAAGDPRPFYHYGMFMLPAALMGVSGAPLALSLSVSALLVGGLLIAGLGCYALASDMGGPVAGIFAVTALLLLPDAASTWPGNGYFGFDWLMLTAPGSGYAIGAGAVALLFFNRWCASQRRFELALSLGLLCAVALLRVQLFTVLALAVALMWTNRWMRHRRLFLWLSAAGLLVVIVIVINAVPALAQLLHQHANFTSFMRAAYVDQRPNALAQPYLALADHLGAGAAAWVGLIFLPLLMLGPWVLLYPFTQIFLSRARALTRQDLMPVMVLLGYLLTVAFSGVPSNGDLSEYKHRPFVLVYALFIVWPVAQLTQHWLLARRDRALEYAALAGSGLVICLVAFADPNIDPQNNRLVWSSRFQDVALTPGIGAAAAYVKARATPGDVMLTVATHPYESVAFASLTGVPQYLAMGGVKWSRVKGAPGAATDSRMATIDLAQAATSRGQLEQVMRQAGVRWVIVALPTAHFGDADFAQGQCQVYWLKPRPTP